MPAPSGVLLAVFSAIANGTFGVFQKIEPVKSADVRAPRAAPILCGVCQAGASISGARGERPQHLVSLIALVRRSRLDGARVYVSAALTAAIGAAVDRAVASSELLRG